MLLCLISIQLLMVSYQTQFVLNSNTQIQKPKQRQKLVYNKIGKIVSMLHLSKDAIIQTFLELGFSPLDYLYLDEIQKVISQLNQQPFDADTLQQLQNQCTTNTRGQIKVEDLVGAFVKAENILVQRDFQVKKLVTKLQKEVNDKYKTNVTDRQLQKIQEELQQAKEELVSNNINLQIVRKPFMFKKTTSQRSPIMQAQNSAFFSRQQRANQQQQERSLPGEGLLGIANTHTFTWIFQLSILILILLLPCMFYTPCYMSSLILLLIILNMISGYFCRFILRVWLGLVGVSILVDAVWYLVGIKPYWHPTSDFTADVHSYLRLTVILYGVVVLGKLILFVLLVTEYNTDESEKKIVSVFGFTEIELSHDDYKKNMFVVLNKRAHHDHFEERGH